MLTSEADQLLRQMARAMAPAQPPWKNDDTVLEDWVKVIQRRGADPDHVRAVFRQWYDEGNTRWMNLYKFREYLDRAAKSKPREQSHDYKACDACGGTGWMQADNFTHNATTYTAVQPCVCSAGNYAANSDTWKEAQRAQR